MLGTYHYFAFSEEGMVVFSPVSAAGDEIQVDVVIDLTPSLVTAIGDQVCAAIQAFGPCFDEQFVGMSARVVPARVDLGFRVTDTAG